MIQGAVGHAWGETPLVNLAVVWLHAETGVRSRAGCSTRLFLENNMQKEIIAPTIDDLVKPERILKAMHECENGVRWKASVQGFELDTLMWAASIRNDLINGTFKTKGFKRFDIVERGKLRHIQAVHISERAVQKLLCEYALKPVILPKLIYDNSASLKGKGTAFALKRLREHLRWHCARYGKTGAVLVMDYTNFFDSMPHDGVIAALQEGQTDPLIRKYIADFVNAFDGDYGIGLGSEISQLAAVLYPTPVDKFIKEQLRVHCYARYMDDSYIIHPDRRFVEESLSLICKEAQKYGLTINRKKTKIHNLASDDFVFLKKRVHLEDNGKIILRLTRQNIQREEARLRYVRAEYDAGRMSADAARQSYKAWRGYAKSYNAYRAVGNMDRYAKSILGDFFLKGDEKANAAYCYT